MSDVFRVRGRNDYCCRRFHGLFLASGLGKPELLGHATAVGFDRRAGSCSVVRLRTIPFISYRLVGTLAE